MTINTRMLYHQAFFTKLSNLTNMKNRLFLIAGLLLNTLLINAQKDFRPGQLVKVNGDTMTGEIDFRGDLLMGQVCRFKLNDNDKEVVYSPFDINEFRFNGSKYFVSKEVNGQKIFLEFLIKGKINIYSYRDQKGDHFFIEKEGLGLSELPYEEGTTYKDNTPYEFKSTTHIGLLNIYMNDAPDFQSRIAKMNKPKQGWLVDLAEDYHKKVCKDEACIIFEKQLPFIKVNLELVAGFSSVKNEEDNFYYYIRNGDNNSQKYFQTGVLANFWLPRVNEKLFLRTGILYSTFKSDDTSKKYYKIPIQIEYIYPKGNFKPKLSYGINLYKPFNYTVSIMPGLNIKITNSVYLDINYFADFLPNYKLPLIPDKIFSSGILSGLYIVL
jgi:hypothetical protein